MTVALVALDHVQLAAPKDSESKAIEFYNGILGLPVVKKPETLEKNGGVWFSNGVINLHIGIEEPFIPAKKAHPAFVVEDLEKTKQILNEKSVPFKEDFLLPGANRIYVHDPFGNRIELLEWKKK